MLRGFLRPSKLANCKGKVTFHGWCPIEKLGFRSAGGDLCQILEKAVKKVVGAGKGFGFEFKCPKGQRCCLKKRYAGEYKVSIVVTKVKLSWSCSVSASVSGTVTLKGDIGRCRQTIIEDEGERS